MSVQQAVLGELVKGPNYPYALAALCHASVPSIYQATVRLVKLGLAEPVIGENHGQRKRNYYRATDAGVEAHREAVVRALRYRHEQLREGLLRAQPDEAMGALDEYESWLLGELRAERHFGTDTASRLVALELQFINEGCLQYVEAARALVTQQSERFAVGCASCNPDQRGDA